MEEQMKQLIELSDKLDLMQLTRSEMEVLLKSASYIDIENELWRLYCFANDVKNILNQRK